MAHIKILAVSDVESKYIWDHFDPSVFRGVDLIISCGDLKAKYLDYLVTLIPAPLFYVHGNHDKGFLTMPPTGCDCIDGKLITYRGVRILGLGGCKSARTAAYEYNEYQMWRRVRKMESAIRKVGGVDILVSHAPAIGIGDDPGTMHEGFEALRHIDEVYSPALHLFGHVHLRASPTDPNAVYRLGSTTLINCTGYRIIDLPTPAEPTLPPQQTNFRFFR